MSPPVLLVGRAWQCFVWHAVYSSRYDIDAPPALLYEFLDQRHWLYTAHATQQACQNRRVQRKTQRRAAFGLLLILPGANASLLLRIGLSHSPAPLVRFLSDRRGRALFLILLRRSCPAAHAASSGSPARPPSPCLPFQTGRYRAYPHG